MCVLNHYFCMLLNSFRVQDLPRNLETIFEFMADKFGQIIAKLLLYRLNYDSQLK